MVRYIILCSLMYLTVANFACPHLYDFAMNCIRVKVLNVSLLPAFILLFPFQRNLHPYKFYASQHNLHRTARLLRHVTWIFVGISKSFLKMKSYPRKKSCIKQDLCVCARLSLNSQVLKSENMGEVITFMSKLLEQNKRYVRSNKHALIHPSTKGFPYGCI